MGKTYDLRVIARTLLKQTLGEVYYEIASTNAIYPYKVFELANIDLGDMARDDLILIVHVWGKDIKEVDEIADGIEATLNGTNAPNGNSYPTFYRMSRNTIPDEDKSIKHKELKFNIQNYYTGE